MRFAELAQEYRKRNGLRAKTIVKNCRRWDRFGLPATAEGLTAFRQQALAAGLSPETIEKTVTDVLTVNSSQGKTLSPGKRLRRPAPEPKPAPLATVNAIWEVSPHWFRRWLVLTYWTAARCEDSLRIFRTVTSQTEVIRLRADKTGRNHVWPVLPWLQEWLMLPSAHPLNGVSLHFTNVLRDGLTLLCEQAGVERITPQQLRQRSITEWSRANATAGAIVHGCGLGVLSHYLDPLQILESAAPRVRLPECFGATSATGEESLLANFRRLDQSAQDLIAGTAERLAAG